MRCGLVSPDRQGRLASSALKHNNKKPNGESTTEGESRRRRFQKSTMRKNVTPDVHMVGQGFSMTRREHRGKLTEV